MYKPIKPFSIKLDEKMTIDRVWYLIDISPKGIVKVYNYFSEDENGGYKRVFINERGWFKATPSQIKRLKQKLIKL